MDSLGFLGPVLLRFNVAKAEHVGPDSMSLCIWLRRVGQAMVQIGLRSWEHSPSHSVPYSEVIYHLLTRFPLWA